MDPREKYEASMLALVDSIKATAAAFLAASDASQAMSGEIDDLFEHALLVETRAAMKPVWATCAGAPQMLGIQLLTPPSIESV